MLLLFLYIYDIYIYLSISQKSHNRLRTVPACTATSPTRMPGTATLSTTAWRASTTWSLVRTVSSFPRRPVFATGRTRRRRRVAVLVNSSTSPARRSTIAWPRRTRAIPTPKTANIFTSASTVKYRGEADASSARRSTSALENAIGPGRYPNGIRIYSTRI